MNNERKQHNNNNTLSLYYALCKVGHGLVHREASDQSQIHNHRFKRKITALVQFTALLLSTAIISSACARWEEPAVRYVPGDASKLRRTDTVETQWISNEPASWRSTPLTPDPFKRGLWFGLLFFASPAEQVQTGHALSVCLPTF